MSRTNMNLACALAFALTAVVEAPAGSCSSLGPTEVHILRRHPEKGATGVPVNSSVRILFVTTSGYGTFSSTETRLICASSSVPADVESHWTWGHDNWKWTDEGWVFGSTWQRHLNGYHQVGVFDPVVPMPPNAPCRVEMDVSCHVNERWPDTVDCGYYSGDYETWVLTEFTTGDSTDLEPPSIPGPITMEAVMYRHSGYKGGGRRWAVEVSFPDPGGDFRPEELLFFLWLKSAQEGYPDRVMVNWWEDAFLRDGRVHIPFSMGPDFKTVRCVRFWAEDPVGYQTGWSTTQCFDPSGLRKDWYCLCGAVGRPREHKPVFLVLLLAILLVGITRRR